MALAFFKEVIYPRAAQEYQECFQNTSHLKPESGEPLIVHLLMQCIKDLNIPREQVRSQFLSNKDIGVWDGIMQPYHSECGNIELFI